MSRRALYYPSAHIANPLFLFNTLLYWDKVACIVPFSGFRSSSSFSDHEMSAVMHELHDRLVDQIAPTPAQQGEVRERISAFASRPPPSWCRAENLRLSRKYIIYVEKLGWESAQLLESSGWGQFHRDDGEGGVLVDASVGAVIMSAFADACTSDAFTKITNDPGGFVANCNLLLDELGSEHGLSLGSAPPLPQPPTGQAAGDLGLLFANVPMLMGSKEGLNATVLRRLLLARQDPETDARRHAFCDKVDKYLADLRCAKPEEKRIIVEHFNDALDQDRKLLKTHLRRFGIENLSAKDSLIAVGAGTLAALAATHPVYGAIGAGALSVLVGGLARLPQARANVLDKHWSSWLLGDARGKLSIV
jgi:hypothetical protein